MPEVTLEELLAPGYLAAVIALPLAEIREQRAGANEVETGLSYLRRLVQGRLDIAMAEQARRAAGLPAGDLADLIQRLPEILGERVHAPGPGRLPALMTPGEVDRELAARLDEIIPPDQLASLPELSDADLAAVVVLLHDLEREVSLKRRSLHAVLDGLQEEIVRRYQTGEATVDHLLG
jgi:hypothetical protein